LARTPASPTERQVNLVILSNTGTIGTYRTYTFNNGSIDYLGSILNQSFRYVLIDNIGTGSIRVTYNRPDYDISSSVDGAKTLSSGDSLYIEEAIWCIRIYFISNSTVELVLNSDKETIG